MADIPNVPDGIGGGGLAYDLQMLLMLRSHGPFASSVFF